MTALTVALSCSGIKLRVLSLQEGLSCLTLCVLTAVVQVVSQSLRVSAGTCRIINVSDYFREGMKRFDPSHHCGCASPYVYENILKTWIFKYIVHQALQVPSSSRVWKKQTFSDPVFSFFLWLWGLKKFLSRLHASLIFWSQIQI